MVFLNSLGSGCGGLLQQLLHFGDVVGHCFILGFPCSEKKLQGCRMVSWEFVQREIAHLEQAWPNLQQPSKHPIWLSLSG